MAAARQKCGTNWTFTLPRDRLTYQDLHDAFRAKCKHWVFQEEKKGKDNIYTGRISLTTRTYPHLLDILFPSLSKIVLVASDIRYSNQYYLLEPGPAITDLDDAHSRAQATPSRTVTVKLNIDHYSGLGLTISTFSRGSANNFPEDQTEAHPPKISPLEEEKEEKIITSPEIYTPTYLLWETQLIQQVSKAVDNNYHINIVIYDSSIIEPICRYFATKSEIGYLSFVNFNDLESRLSAIRSRRIYVLNLREDFSEKELADRFHVIRDLRGGILEPIDVRNNPPGVYLLISSLSISFLNNKKNLKCWTISDTGQLVEYMPPIEESIISNQSGVSSISAASSRSNLSTTSTVPSMPDLNSIGVKIVKASKNPPRIKAASEANSEDQGSQSKPSRSARKFVDSTEYEFQMEMKRHIAQNMENNAREKEARDELRAEKARMQVAQDHQKEEDLKRKQETDRARQEQKAKQILSQRRKEEREDKKAEKSSGSRTGRVPVEKPSPLKG